MRRDRWLSPGDLLVVITIRRHRPVKLQSGVQIAPLVLHTDVASLEDHEPPYEEYFRVPPDTADRVNAAKRAGRRVVAVCTTVVRALETVTDERRRTYPGEG